VSHPEQHQFSWQHTYGNCVSPPHSLCAFSLLRLSRPLLRCSHTLLNGMCYRCVSGQHFSAVQQARRCHFLREEVSARFGQQREIENCVGKGETTLVAELAVFLGLMGGCCCSERVGGLLVCAPARPNGFLFFLQTLRAERALTSRICCLEELTRSIFVR
jgi:hypothetical protein